MIQFLNEHVLISLFLAFWAVCSVVCIFNFIHKHWPFVMKSASQQTVIGFNSKFNMIEIKHSFYDDEIALIMDRMGSSLTDIPIFDRLQILDRHFDQSDKQLALLKSIVGTTKYDITVVEGIKDLDGRTVDLKSSIKATDDDLKKAFNRIEILEKAQ